MRSPLACRFLLLCAPLYAQLKPNTTWSFAAFDVPGAYATQPHSINSSGTICGTYTTSAAGPFHAFVRNAAGVTTTFDAPDSAFTLALGISDGGTIVGFWSPDLTGTIEHGFTLDSAGNLRSFDAPGFTITAAYGINNTGAIVANLLNEPGPSLPYLRNSAGTYTLIQPPGVSGLTVNGINDQDLIIGELTGNGATPKAFAVPAQSPPALTLFKYPGSTTSTIANGVNDKGHIVGSWNSGQAYEQVTHGFIRDDKGRFQDIEYPNAISTAVFGIANSGSITGSFTGTDGKVRGFLAQPNVQPLPAAVTSIDIPGAAATFVTGINASREICGSYRTTEAGPMHAFVRDASGNIVTFDVPGSVITVAAGINDAGEVTGYWTPQLNDVASHVFIRDHAGGIVSFDVPNYIINSAVGINDSGQMTVNALTEPGPGVSFLRNASGVYAPIEMPGANLGSVEGLNNAGSVVGCSYGVGGNEQAFVLLSTAPATPVEFSAPAATTATCAFGINDRNMIVGYYTTGYRGGESSHGFVRLPNGTIETRDVPGSIATIPMGINDDGWIIGDYGDAQGNQHGYMMAPVRGLR